MDLTSDIVFRIGCLTGPKAAVCLGLSSKLLSSLSPIDSQGLTDQYIEALPCPGPIAAGIIGISSHELITLKPDAAGTCRSGVITHIRDRLFAFCSEDGDRELIGWQSIGKVDAEAIPICMPRFEPELVFLMMRRETPQHVTERMLYFLVRMHKAYLTCEVVRRLGPSPRVLGRVLLMVWLHDSVLSSVCDDLTHPYTDCCRILLDSGAAIAEEDAVDVHIRATFDGILSQPSRALRSKVNVYFQSWRDSYVNVFRQWYVATTTQISHDHWGAMLDDLLDDWFPLQLTVGDGDYLGANDDHITYDGEVSRWIYVGFDVIDNGVEDGRQFYSVANSIRPPLGDWLRYPSADYEQGSVLEVSKVDTRSWFDALSSDKQALLYAAEQVKDDWASRGWRFGGTSRSEQLQEILRSYPQGWERACSSMTRKHAAHQVSTSSTKACVCELQRS